MKTNFSRLICWVSLFAITFNGLFFSFQETDSKSFHLAPQTIPSPPLGGPSPTINLSPTHAYMGQPVQVSGVGVSPYPSVRLSWLADGATHTAAIAELSPTGAYLATLIVPDDVAPGPYRICASVTSSELAELACKEFTIDPAPPGSISGSIPLSVKQRGQAAPVVLSAFANLRTTTGAAVLSVPVQLDGTFQLSSVPAGSYILGVTGTTPSPVASQEVTVLPAQMNPVQLNPPNIDIACKGVLLENVAVIDRILADVNGLEIQDHKAGLYIRNGPALMVTFTAEVNGAGPAISKMDFSYEDHPLGSDEDGPPWQVTIDVSALPEDEQGLQYGYLRATPTFVEDYCSYQKSVTIASINSPLDAPYLDGSLTWNGSAYQIVGQFQHYPGMPVNYPISIPVVNIDFNNSVSAEVLQFEGILELNGDVTLQFVRLDRKAELLNVPVVDDTPDPEITGEKITGNFSNLEEKIDYSKFLFHYPPGDDFDIQVPILGLPYGYPYVFELRFSMWIGLHGGISYTGWLTSWLGELDAYIRPYAGPTITMELKLTLLGFVSGGAKMTGGMDIILPIDTSNMKDPPVTVSGPCFSLYVNAEVYISITFYDLTIWEGTIVDYESEPGCSPNMIMQARQQGTDAIQADLPKWMTSPAVAAADDGRMLSIYVDNVTPEVVTPTLKVMTRFWNETTGNWGSPQALSDGIHMVNDPTVTFFGNSSKAMAAWSQNTFQTIDEAGGDVKTAMAHYEIYYAVWDGSTWSAPQRLTDNLVPDGFSAVSGTSFAGEYLSIAWVTDLDGDFTTRNDWRIAYANWDKTSQAWGDISLVPNTNNSLNAEPSLTRTASWGEGTIVSSIFIAYTEDLDGNLSTYQDRKIKLVTESCMPMDEAGCTTYPTLRPVPMPVPVGSDSPHMMLYEEDPYGYEDQHPNLTFMVHSSFVTDIAAGILHTCALTGEGGVKCWGYNGQGGLGDGTIIDRNTPVAVSGLGYGVTAIDAGYLHACAVTSAGKVKCWGGNNNGQLGDGTTVDRHTPVAVFGLSSGITAIATGAYHSCVLTEEGWVRCWGRNDDGQLGNGNTIDQLTPVAVYDAGQYGSRAIAVGGYHTCLLDGDGAVWCWGDNSYGQLGDGTTIDRNTPVVVSGLSSGVTAITTGHYHTCALLSSGAVKCWGYNIYGQLGDGTTIDRHTPVAVATLSSGIGSITAGGVHTCALSTVGGVKCWGNNYNGELGDGTTISRYTPVEVPALESEVSQINIGYYHSCALNLTGGVKCWGRNNTGQVGDGTNTDRHEPVDVTGLTSEEQPNSGLSTLSEIWIAHLLNPMGGGLLSWYIHPLFDEQGHKVYGESPHISYQITAGPTIVPIILFRRFEKPGSTAGHGQLARAVTDSLLRTLSLSYLTQDEYMHWQPALAVQRITNLLVTLNVRRELGGFMAPLNLPNSGAAFIPTNTTQLSMSGDALESLVVPNLADPALHADLQFSTAHAPPGSSVVITATLSNQGSSPSDGVLIELRADDPITGTLITQSDQAGMDIGETRTITFTITTGSGNQPIWAVLSTTGNDLSTANNQAYGDIGELPAPDYLNVSPLSGSSPSFMLSWHPPEVSGVAGYRVLRGLWPSGPFELVGETESTTFIDWPVMRGVGYAYVVQAFDAAGVRSAFSLAAYGFLELLDVFLPIIRR